MSYVLTIGGVTKVPQAGWSIDETANGLNLFRFSVKSEAGTYRPALDAEVILTEGGVRIFGGIVRRPAESGLAPPRGTSILTSVEADDFNALTDRRFGSFSILAGATLRDVCIEVATWIPGVTVHPSQVTGPTLPSITYTDVRIRDILNDLTVQSGGYLWTVDYNKLLRMALPGSVSAPFNITEANRKAIGDIEVEPVRDGYANHVKITAINSTEFHSTTISSVASDASYLTDPWEALYQAPAETAQDALDVMAAMLLARSLVVRKEVRYHTLELGAHPGQTQTIDVASRNVNNTFVITDVRIRDMGTALQHLDHEVTALEGTTWQPGWQEKWRQLGGHVTSTGIAVGGGGPPTTSGGAAVFWLGGSAVEAVQTTSGAWVAASSIQITLDTVALGTSTGTVSVQLRADSGTVTARLRNVSDGTTVGTSAAASGTTFGGPITFAVTLTAGSKRYRLELSPSVSSSDVAGMGYLQL